MDTPWKQAIIQVLQDNGEPMDRTEIADTVISTGLRVNVGATPAHTVAAQISMSIRSEGEDSPFIRVRRGEYALRSTVGGAVIGDRGPEMEDEESTEAGGVQAFGIYWSRSLVSWKRNTKLLGQQQIGSETVDFAGQVGVYLLYDAREVVYVGRSIDRPIGLRLYEHNQDRLRARWDRFSWFGLYPVSEDGSLVHRVNAIDAESMIRALEAVLIESMEPRQNRRRGDDLTGLEYIQKGDPEIEHEQKLAVLEELGSALKRD